ARVGYELALSVLDRDAEPGLRASVLANLGTLEHELGRNDKARDCLERALSIFRSLGVRRPEALALGNLASVHAELGRLKEARGQFEEAIATLHAIGDRVHEGVWRGHLAGVLAE